MKRTRSFWHRTRNAILAMSFIMAVLLAMVYLYLETGLPKVESLKNIQLQVPLRIYTSDGKLVQEYGETRRIPVNYADIPPLLVKAILATEDQRFFEHPGVDILGLGRATLKMLKTGTMSQGGSTITMQVARNFFLNRKKTFLRKFNEILLAIHIDRELPKEKILELYLNKIYLGNRAYGVGAAAQVYYGKQLHELTLAELAMIAGLPQAPSTQNPVANPAAAKKRRDHVLLRLFEEKYITEAQYKKAIAEPLTAKSHSAVIEVEAPYVAEMIRQALYEHFGHDAYNRGYKVYTTINTNLQIHANQVIEQHVLAYDKRHGYRGPAGNIGGLDESTIDTIYDILAQYPDVHHLQAAVVLKTADREATVITRNGQVITLAWDGMSWAKPALPDGKVGNLPQSTADIMKTGDIIYITRKNDNYVLAQLPELEAALVALNPQNGAIEALIGGFNFEKSKFNRATQATRQPGSSFKPFVYAAALALNNRYTLSTIINDAPIVIDDPSQSNQWRPHNHTLTFNGPTRFREALIHSNNMVSIRILNDIGIDYTIDFLTNFGFQKKNLPRALSLALGSLSVSPLDLTVGYAVFANGGYKVEPYIIDRITDDEGNDLLKATPALVCNQACIESGEEPDIAAPRVIPEDIAFLINSTLQDVIKRGSGRHAASLKRNDLAGKTGTTNDQFDTWFAGYNENIAVTAWTGFDNPASLYEYAATLALPLWTDFMKQALKNKPETELKPSANIVKTVIDAATGLLSNPDAPNTTIEYFRTEELPAQSPEQPSMQNMQNPKVTHKKSSSSTYEPLF